MDKEDQCSLWANNGYCEIGPLGPKARISFHNHIIKNCAESCGKCGSGMYRV